MDEGGRSRWTFVFELAIAASAFAFLGVAMQRAKVSHLATVVPRMCPTSRLESETARFIFYDQTPDPNKDPLRIIGIVLACVALVAAPVGLVLATSGTPWHDSDATVKSWALFLTFRVILPILTVVGLLLAGFKYTVQFYSDAHGQGKISEPYEALKKLMQQMAWPVLDVTKDVVGNDGKTVPLGLARELADRWLVNRAGEGSKNLTQQDAEAALGLAFGPQTSAAAERARTEVIGLLAPARDLRYRGAVALVVESGNVVVQPTDEFFKILKTLEDENALDPRPPIDVTSAILFSIAWRVALITSLTLFYNNFAKN